MKRASSLIALLATVTVSLVQAAPRLEITKSQEGNFSVQFCDSELRAGSWIGFQIENGIIEKELLNSTSCATKTISKGSLAENKKLTVHKMNKSDFDSAGVLYTSVVKPTAPKTPDTSKCHSVEVTIGEMRFSICNLEAKDNEVQKIEIKVCSKNFKPSDAVSVTNRATLGTGKVVSKSTFVNKEKCFTTEMLKGEIQDGDIIGIALFSVQKPVELVLTGIPWKRTVIVTPPTTPTTPTTPDKPTLKVESDANIIEKARLAANRFAANVAQYLGQVENIRYNIFLGFSDAKRWSQNFGVRYEGMSEYKAYYPQGYDEQYAPGSSEGKKYATNYASDLAGEDVAKAIDQVMQKSVTELNVPVRTDLKQMNFAGLNYPGAQPTTIEVRLKEKDKSLQDQINKTFVVRNGDLVLADDFYTYETYRLAEIKEFQFDLLDSYFKDSNAFEAWRRGHFETRTNTYTEYFFKISDKKLYEKASENEELFRKTFKEVYERSIRTQWNNVVRIYRPEIKRMGEEIYVETTKEYAAALGRYNGKVAGYREASKKSFFAAIETEYKLALKTAVTNVQTKTIFSRQAIAVQNSKGGSVITIGDTIDVILTSATNRGMKAGYVILNPVSTDQLVVLRPELGAPLGALTSLKTPALFKSALFISRLNSPNQDIPITVLIEGRPYTAQLRSTFEALVTALAKNPDVGTKHSIQGHIALFLNQEWHEKKRYVGNGFEDDNALLVRRLVDVYQSRVLSDADRAEIKQYAQKFRAAYGSQPSYLSGYQADWDSAIKILADAGL